MVLPRIRTVPTASGGTAVQVIWRYTGNRPVLDHVGTAHTDEELAVLFAHAQRLMHGDQAVLDLDFGPAAVPTGMGTVEAPIPVSGERAGFLLDAIRGAFDSLGLGPASDGDGVFFDLVTARMIYPGSKYESIETLAEVGVHSASYSTIQRRLPVYATPEFRDRITHALAERAGIGPGVVILYDVTTLHFETDTADDLRKPGFSKERRLEPQITVGTLTDQSGFPL